jgi:hypothetical protein
LSLLVIFSASGSYVLEVQSAYAGTGDSDRVLKGIPAIARAFAPVGGVNWQDFAKVLAGICAVESRCDPTYPHYVNGGVYSQYQGLFQMNVAEVAKAETNLQQMLPQMQAAADASSDQKDKEAFQRVKEAIDAARSLSREARRFHPEYGIILGAAKHIRTNAVLAKQYPGKPDWQAAGHMTAQFAGITEAKILAGRFTAPITGTVGDANTEAGALAANKVSGATVADAISDARNQYGKIMVNMMTRMSQVTNGLTTVPTNIDPFQPPSFANQAGTGPVLGVPFSGVSTLMETGLMKPLVAPPYPQTTPPNTSNIPPYNGPTSTPPPSPQPGSTPSTDGAPIGMILAQPNPIAVGRKITVSWTSVHLSDSEPCQVYTNDTFLAQGNEGTRAVDAGPATGPETFTMKCKDQQGNPFTQSATVTVQ